MILPLTRPASEFRLTWSPTSKRLTISLPSDVSASHHHAQPFRRPRDACIVPPRPAVLKRKTLVEQHHVVPLRALRFVHRQHIAVIELVIGFSLLPRYRFDRAPKAVAADRDFCHFVAEVFVRR